MMQTLTGDRGRKWRKAGLGALLGGVAGFAGAFAVIQFGEAGMLGTVNTSQMIALLVALIYLLMGIAVAAGAVAPKFGAQFLNVEDAEELNEERAMLVPSALGSVLMALALAALALTGDGSLLSPTAALVTVAAAFTLAVWLSLRSMRHADELMRQVMRESVAASYYLTFAALAGWAALAHLQLVAAPAMLDIVTLFHALALIGCFWVVGRRGMMMR